MSATRLPALLAVASLLALAAACAGPGPASPVVCSGSSRPLVVAAENFWGSIAEQLAGGRACVVSIVVNPATDPHAYEARPSDARLVARARYFIENGAGYDPWASKLLDANPVSGRLVLDVGELSGKKAGDNPHLWYSPAIVARVIDKVSADLAAIDPAGASFFEQQKTRYQTTGLQDYLASIQAIRSKYAGTPVAATESVFAYLAGALDLNLITPYGYLKAISEGTDPSPADKATVQRQIEARAARVLVYNSQNTTPEVAASVGRARARGIPVVTVTETLSPANLSFQDWQTGQLKELLAALGG